VSDAPQVTDNTAAARFECEVDGQRAELAYRRRGDRLVLLHTETPADLEGRGIGGSLVRAAVDRAQRDGLTVVPLCPFARDWLERHPDIASQVKLDLGANLAAASQLDGWRYNRRYSCGSATSTVGSSS
jgi:predicted GNAT family acetyltransferase